MKKQIINVETGELVERDLTKEELDQVAKDEAEIIAKNKIIEEIAEKRAELLKRLGITEQEAQLLLS